MMKTTAIAAKKLPARWFNPGTGAATDIGIVQNKGQFSVPYAKQIQENKAGPDWILVMDDAPKNYAVPANLFTGDLFRQFCCMLFCYF